MARRDYISDNLVDIRDRLRQYAKPIETTAEDPRLDLPLRSAVPAVQPSPIRPVAAPAAPSSSVRTAVARGEEFERSCRDLQGRIGRDLAEVSAELELLGERQRELEKFRSVLNHVSEELARLPAAPEQEKALEHLRIEYFQASGRAAAFGLRPGSVPLRTGGGEPAEKSFGRLFLEALPIGFFLLAGAVILALALVFIFC